MGTFQMVISPPRKEPEFLLKECFKGKEVSLGGSPWNGTRREGGGSSVPLTVIIPKYSLAFSILHQRNASLCLIT